LVIRKPSYIGQHCWLKTPWSRYSRSESHHLLDIMAMDYWARRNYRPRHILPFYAQTSLIAGAELDSWETRSFLVWRALRVSQDYIFRTSGAVHEPKTTTSFSSVSRFSKLWDSKDAIVLLGCPSPGIFEYPFSSAFVAARSLAYNVGPPELTFWRWYWLVRFVDPAPATSIRSRPIGARPRSLVLSSRKMFVPSLRISNFRQYDDQKAVQ